MKAPFKWLPSHLCSVVLLCQSCDQGYELYRLHIKLPEKRMPGLLCLFQGLKLTSNLATHLHFYIHEFCLISDVHVIVSQVTMGLWLTSFY